MASVTEGDKVRVCIIMSNVSAPTETSIRVILGSQEDRSIPIGTAIKELSTLNNLIWYTKAEMRADIPSDVILNIYTVDFPDGSTNGDMQCRNFSTVDDSVHELDEIFRVRLEGIPNNVMVINDIAAVTIIDDEG